MGGIGGDDLKLEEEVIAVLGEWSYLQGWDFVDRRHENEGVMAVPGEWGCFLQRWDLVDCRYTKEGVIAALGEWGCFLWAWGSHLGQLGHHLEEGASDLGEWGFHRMEVSCHLGDWGMCQPAQDQFHQIEWSCYLGEGWGVVIRLRITFLLFFSFFFSFCFSSVFLSGLQKCPFLSCKNNFGLFYKIFGFSSHNPLTRSLMALCRAVFVFVL